MTQQQQPITPPPELIQRWSEQFEAGRSLYAMFEDIYRAGADTELEACCEWVDSFQNKFVHVHDLRLVRRPQSPCLKEQALDALTLLCKGPDATAFVTCRDTIRRALEQLDD